VGGAGNPARDVRHDRAAAAQRERQGGASARVKDFDRAQQEFREYYDANIATLRDAEESVRAQIVSILADQPAFATPHVVSRVKAREECLHKFQRKYLPRLAGANATYAIKDHIADLIGIRVICLYEPDIGAIVRLLEKEFDVLELTDKAHEVEVTADTFRYKGLHLVMALSERRKRLPAYSRFAGLRFEVQVRTAIQDAWSTLDHAIKYKRQVPHELTRRINALAALFEIADREFLSIRNQLSGLAQGSPARRVAPAVDGLRSATSDLLAVLQRHFPRRRFDARKLDAFVDELQSFGPPVTADDLDGVLAAEMAALHEYARHQWQRFRNALKPLTLVRHALYLRDPATYRNVLFEAQRARLDEWRLDAARRRAEPAARKDGDVAAGRDLDRPAD
jgi:putative GTP pyrophosphokinase